MFSRPYSFKTYQDVKHNLIYWTMGLQTVCFLTVYFIVLSDSHHDWLRAQIVSVSEEIQILAGLGILSVGNYFLALVLVEAFQIHDRLYDAKVIKWRERFDIDFIIRLLTHSFRHELPNNFDDLARANKYEFMKPYYDFVGDGKDGINDHTRTRFYERVTWYWVTQLNEIFLVLLSVVAAIYVWRTPDLMFQEPSYVNDFGLLILALVLLLVANRLFIRLSLTAVSQATRDEIQEILSKPENVGVLRGKYLKLAAS